MDKNRRNALRKVVTDCRRILEEVVGEMLEGRYGITPHKITDATQMQHLSVEDREYREQLLVYLHHIQSSGFSQEDAVVQLIREVAFTHLNRFCAYKMMEVRKIIRESVSRGYESNNVKFYLTDHPEDEQLFNTGQQDVAYKHFLEWLGGTLSEEIGVLFSPHDPANRLLPPQRLLDRVLELINSEDLKDIWAEDETIGWIYQYFTPKELRDQARKESQAPRNSYELAFRNQFYTPSYVVQFLTDNTLGRIWYEMRQGETSLKDLCKYMVCRPNEIFLAEGEERLEEIQENESLSQEELLEQPIYIPYRKLKDPREIRVLDPACGSGHFLLYCFTLLLAIYEESWDVCPEVLCDLRDSRVSKEAFMQQVPGLILEHNLHGIDIDIRATQIAALALWLRAQRAYQEMALKRNRPKITRSNIVCAEPMPGEETLLEEFVADLQPKVLGQFVQAIFNKTKLAGEAGSLLRIEVEIRDIVSKAKNQWKAQPKAEQLAFLLEFSQTKPEKLTMFDVSEITDEKFWNEAESKIIEALREYAEQSSGVQKFQRQLFVNDAVQGFAFVDICQKKFDVILMNPPFGYASEAIGLALDNHRSTDIEAQFTSVAVDRLLSNGLLGMITNRTQLLKPTLAEFRKQTLIEMSQIEICVDLGNGVLDAMVETSAFTSRKAPSQKIFNQSTFFSCLGTQNKSACVRGINDGESNSYFVNSRTFLNLPDARFIYWLHSSFARLMRHHNQLIDDQFVAFGISTTDNFRFLRLFWEVCPKYIKHYVPNEFNSGWIPLAKGGEYSPYYGSIHLLVDWHQNGSDLRSQPDAPIRNEHLYGKAGLTYTKRTASAFAPRILPAGCIPEVNGSVIVPRSSASHKSIEILAITLSRVSSYITDALVAAGDTSFAGSAAKDYIPGVIGKLPIAITVPEISCCATQQITEIKRSLDSCDETSTDFCCPKTFFFPRETRFLDLAKENIEKIVLASKLAAESDEAIERSAFLLSQDAIDELSASVGPLVGKIGATKLNTEIFSRLLPKSTEEIISECLSEGITRKDISKNSYKIDRRLELFSTLLNLDISICGQLLTNEYAQVKERMAEEISFYIGVIFGRWDIRFATGQHPKPELPDPFAPVPVYSPGMLTLDSDLVNYPIKPDQHGILIDDPDHPDDIIRRIRNVLEVIWNDNADAIEQEACEILGVKDLRDYFRKLGNGGFWQDHIKRYSKSRRKDPIYWLLQSSKKNYALWLSYHRLDKDLLFKAQTQYVEPKLNLENNKLNQLNSQRAGLSGSDLKKLEKTIEKQDSLVSELQDFLDKLKRAANLNLEPDLNDGVVLNIAPLWELVPWGEAKKYWQELTQEGKYEWSSISKQLQAKQGG